MMTMKTERMMAKKKMMMQLSGTSLKVVPAVELAYLISGLRTTTMMTSKS